MSANSNRVLLTYETYIPSTVPFVERLYRGVLVATIALFIGVGIFLKTVKIEPEVLTERIARIRTQFLIQEKKPPPPEPKKVKEKAKPIDLTKKPELNQKEEDIQKKPKAKPVRRVYGLRKVYSHGLGAGGRLSDAVIGKLGNTLNKDVDTLSATQEEIKGDVVSVTTITSSPRFKKRVRPEYTKEMIESGVEGIVKVKVLVDIDGKVKRAIILNEIGHGAGTKAYEACLAMEFVPAMRDNVPVAVWIIIPIRFVLLG